MPAPTSYTPTTWVSGTTPASAGNMNHVEGGVSQIVTDYATHQAAGTLDHPDGSVTDAKVGNRTPDETQTATSGAQTLSQCLNFLANMIKQITGKSHWYNAPDTTIAALNTGKLNNDSGAITTDGSGNLTVASISTGAGLSVPYLNYHASSSGTPLRIYENGSSGNGFEIGRLGTDGNGTNNSCIAVLGSGGIGFKNGGISGTKIMEISSGGILTVTGGNPCFVTTNASVGFAAAHSFDAFDVAEQFETDADYPAGAVLCPGPGHKLTRCTHDGCHAAMVVSAGGAVRIGGARPEGEVADPTDKPIAIAGRVKVDAEGTIEAFNAAGQASLVTSNGRGGVRAMRAGETGFALGFALHAAQDGAIGIVVRPMYCLA